MGWGKLSSEATGCLTFGVEKRKMRGIGMAEKFNIKTQYALWVGVIALGVVVVLTGIHVWRVIDDQEAALRWIAQQEARTLARVVEGPVALKDQNALIRGVGQAMNDDEVLYLRIQDESGNTLFRHREPTDLIVVKESIQHSGRSIGTVELGMMRGRVGQRLAIALGWDFGVGLLLIVIAVGGAMILATPVHDSLENLLTYVQAVSKGAPLEEQLETDLAEADAVGRELKSLMKRVVEAQQRQERMQKQLKATQKEMDEYTYVISHDLKEPLRGMEAFSKFLIDGYKDRLDEEGRRHLDIIRKSVLRMQQLINDLLHFSRLSQQKQPMQPIGMNTMLMHLRVRLQHAIETKRVDLIVDKLPTIVCDETAMTEVFHNLISNAIKYNDKTVPTIHVGCTEKINPDTQLPEYEFFVRDNGVGIKKEYFDKIFQIFQRLQRDEEGTGIGLTIVRRVVEWHGGRVWIESEEGKGTTFFFSIPKREVSETGTIIDQTKPPTQGI